MSASSVKSAERVMDVLRFLATRIHPVQSMMISKHLNLPKSSTYHLLNSMKKRSFVIYYPESRAWGLGPAAFEIGGAYLRSEPLSWLGRPVLRELADECGMTAHLAVLHGQDVLYLLKESPTGANGAALISRVGVRLPAHLTAVGRAILMWLPRAQLQAVLPLDQPLIKRTHAGPTLVAELERDLHDSRQLGYAVDQEMTTRGITCVAATVFSHENQPIAGLGVTFVSMQRGVPSIRELAPHVVQAASQLSLALGWEEHANCGEDQNGLPQRWRRQAPGLKSGHHVTRETKSIPTPHVAKGQSRR